MKLNRQRCLIRFGALLSALLSFTHAYAQDSPMFRNDPGHSGYYAGGVAQLHGVAWKFHTKGEVNSSPAIVHGVVYVGSNDGNLYAIDQRTGSQKWAFQTKGRVPSSPAVANGLVYFGSYDGNFYAIDAGSGKLAWKFPTPGERRFAGTHLHGSIPMGETMPDPFDMYLSSPVLLNGAVYFGSGDGNVYALDAATGSLKWKFQTGDVVHSSPAIADGRVFVGSWDSYLYALDATTGKELWRFKTGEDADTHNQVGIQSSPTVADGVVYFGCRDSNLYAVDAVTGKRDGSSTTRDRGSSPRQSFAMARFTSPPRTPRLFMCSMPGMESRSIRSSSNGLSLHRHRSRGICSISQDKTES